MTETPLVPMTKAGEHLDVHPSCVKDHERIGWRVSEAQAEPEAEPKRRGRPPKAKE